MKKKRNWLWISLSIILVIGLVGSIGFYLINDQLKQLVKTPIGTVDLSLLEDGIYKGEYASFPVSVVLEVTIQNHQMTQIVILKHDNGQGKPAEVILSDVIATQSLEVDAIAGATYSSKVILLSLQNALNP